jgi:alkaline phosphatase
MRALHDPARFDELRHGSGHRLVAHELRRGELGRALGTETVEDTEHRELAEWHATLRPDAAEQLAQNDAQVGCRSHDHVIGHTHTIPRAYANGQSILTTHEGVPLYINYATAAIGASQQHTGSEVRIAAQGTQAANVVGVIDQTDENALMKRALGLP